MTAGLLWLVYIGLVIFQPSPARFRHFGVWLLGSSLAVALVLWRVLDDARAALFCLSAEVASATAWYTDASTLRELARLQAEREKLARISSDLVVRSDQIRIARELHDGIGANLVALVWRTQRLQREAGPSNRREMQALTDRAGATLGELRTAVWALHNPNRPWPELVDYVRTRLTESALETSTCSVVDVTGADVGDRTVTADVGRALLRALQAIAAAPAEEERLGHLSITLELRLEVVRALVRRENEAGDPLVIEVPLAGRVRA